MLSSKCLSAQGCHDASFDKKWRILPCDEGRGLHLEFMQTEDVYSAAQVLMEPDAALLMFKEADLYLSACVLCPSLAHSYLWYSCGCEAVWEAHPCLVSFPAPLVSARSWGWIITWVSSMNSVNPFLEWQAGEAGVGLFASVYNMPHRSCFDEVVWWFFFFGSKVIYLFFLHWRITPLLFCWGWGQTQD